jgi:hypothetical protein
VRAPLPERAGVLRAIFAPRVFHALCVGGACNGRTRRQEKFPTEKDEIRILYARVALVNACWSFSRVVDSCF